MEYTRFGEEMRVLRTRRHQTQKDMAEVLGVAKSFLSSVETGRRSIPKGWIDIISDHYHLKPYEYSDVSEPPIPDGGAIPIPEMRTTHSENITTLKTGRSIIS